MSTPSQLAPLTPLRLAGLYLLAFVVLGSYALARPAVESIFLSAYSAKALPWVWLTVVVGTAITVAVYNHFARRFTVGGLLAGACLVSGVILVILRLFIAAPGVPFLLYVWKDIYIVVLVEAFWSFANNVFPLKSARKLYGTFLLAGTAGDIAGNTLVEHVATTLGTRQALWFVLPALGFTALTCGALMRGMTQLPPPEKTKRRVLAGLDVMKKSRYLQLIFVLIVLIQLITNHIDYEFNRAVEGSFVNEDTRTAIIGQIYRAVGILSASLQIISPWLLKWIGAHGVLLGVPLLLGISTTVFAIGPAFVTMAVTKVLNKGFDYSIYRVAKELLYLPLSYREKVEGKAIIDVFGYRSAKGLASVTILALSTLFPTAHLTWFVVILIVGWWFLTGVVLRHYRRLTSE